ncbi:MAG: thiamine diphosphokinase [Candidatus Cloacimonadota bacterium]|nr:thiamine diphosphokinase [Candidatus Cloacimonadota bacterium]
MEKILIVANGKRVQPSIFRKAIDQCRLIVAADGGIEACKQMGIEPDYLIGDMDSVPRDKLLSKKTKKIFNPDQETTDMEKVLKFTESLSPDEIIVLNAFGNRADHTFANYLILRNFSRKIPVQIYDDIGMLSFLKPGKTILQNQMGNIVSFWSFSEVKNIVLSGFKYILQNKNFEHHFLGISNKIIAEVAEIEFSNGELAIYLHWGEGK